MKELLIVKAGDAYLRFLPEGHQLCKMDKASVFPVDQVSRVHALCALAAKTCGAKIEVRKLTIIEEPLEELSEEPQPEDK